MFKMKNLALAALIGLSFVPIANAEWAGQTTIVEGITTVSNPETPLFGEDRQVMEEAWRRGGEDDEEVFFGTISEFLHDDEGNIFLLDGQLNEIMVFDPQGDLLRTMGRQGEGPGEFQNAADMFWSPNGEIGVVQAWPGKVVMLTADGNPGTTFDLPFREGGGFQSVTRGVGGTDRLILAGTAWAREDEKQMQFTYLKSYDLGGNELATFQESKREVNFGNYEFKEEQYVDFQRRWAVAPDGRVAAALDFDRYRLHVWNADGTLDRVIERPEYKAVKRNSEEIENYQRIYEAFTRWNRGSTFKVNKFHQAVEQIFFREDGSLWVQSGANRWRAAADEFTSFDVYDSEGRFLKKVTLEADADSTEDGLFFAGNRAYVVTNLLSAMVARLGTGNDIEDETGEELEPVTVVSFEFPPLLVSGP